jgi:hypothetical protein
MSSSSLTPEVSSAIMSYRCPSNGSTRDLQIRFNDAFSLKLPIKDEDTFGMSCSGSSIGCNESDKIISIFETISSGLLFGSGAPNGITSDSIGIEVALGLMPAAAVVWEVETTGGACDSFCLTLLLL